MEVHALNRQGERYMARWDPERMERTTRDINSVAAAMEIRAGRCSKAGGTYLSFKHLPRNLVNFSAEWFPRNLRSWRAAGFHLRSFFPDIGEEAWEVAPACHFWNGGIRIDEDCATNVPGLFAAGEGTAGIHGANRLAGNALTMTQVWGKRAGASAARFAKDGKLRKPPTTQIEKVVRKFVCLKSDSSGPTVTEVRLEIRRIAGDLVGIIREEKNLQQALKAIADLRRDLARQHVVNQDSRFNREWVEGLQNENSLDVLEAIVLASIARQESRGAMYRVDYPATDNDRWLCNLVLRRKDNQWEMQEAPVNSLYLSLPAGTRTYGRRGESNHG